MPLIMIRSSRTEIATAWFGALCFFLSAVEYLIPKPLPFLRLGLANLPIMLATEILPLPAFAVLVLVKILAQGLIGGTLFSYIFLFSAAGTLSSALLMYLLALPGKRRISYAGISVAGAFASNAAQLGMARWYIFGPSAWYIAPPFLAVGAVSGLLLGLFANRFASRSQWLEGLRSGTGSLPKDAFDPDSGAQTGAAASKQGFFNAPAFRAAAGFAFLGVLLFSDNPAIQGVVVAAAAVLLICDGGKISPVPALVMTAGIIGFNLLTPFGKVLYQPFGLPITEGALLSGIQKALTVEGMLFISRWMMKSGFRLPGKPGELIARVLSILGYLTARKSRFDPKEPIASIDRIMLGDETEPR